MNYGEDDWKVLEHLARHILSFLVVIETFVLKKPAQELLTSLESAGLLSFVEFASIPMLQLTRKGAALIGAPQYRGIGTPGSFAMAKHLAALWWCLQSWEIRYRLARLSGRDDDEQETLSLFPEVKAPLCFDEAGLHRLFVLDPEKTDALDIVKTLRREVTRDGTLGEWIQNGWYRFTMLSPHQHHRKAIEHAIKRDRKRILPPYLQAGRIRIEAAPTDPVNFWEDFKNAFQTQTQRQAAR